MSWKRLTSPIAYEKGDHLYLVTPLTPSTPSESDIEEYAYGKDIVAQLREKAPNQFIAWYGGHYVEADRPNLNGAMWLSQDLAIASLTPMFMPVTVMHDPRTAVGLIADLALKDPQRDRVPRPKIETALAIWKHRFPDVDEEAQHNYQQGTLMQSMECLSPFYDCSECGMRFHKLPHGAERDNWCAHLLAASSGDAQTANASRILRGVTFTGTGLIFGSRGAQGADPSANLDSFAEEVAAFHQEQHASAATSRRPKNTPKRSRKMEIEDREYERLVKERDDFKSEAERLRQEKSDAEKAAEAAEAEKTKAEAKAADEESARKAAEEKVKDHEEKANRQTLASTRFEALGSEFAAKLDAMPTTKKRLQEQAGTLEDQAWDERLQEVEEATGVKRDAKKEGDTSTGDQGGRKDLFTTEEVASSRLGGGGGGGGNREPTKSERASVMRGLIKPRTPAKTS